MADQDLKDILDLDNREKESRDPRTPQLSKESIMGTFKEKKVKKSDVTFRRPSGMNREVYALLYSDSTNASSTSLIPTDSGSGYRQPKARLGRKHVRPWKWMPFTNSAREDGLILHHWRRTTEEGKDYPFAQFNKTQPIISYTDEEYTNCLQEPGWTREETDHLIDLCKQFDLRFIIIHDRYDTEKFQKRSVEDLKTRYYSISNRLNKLRNPNIEESQLIAYDAPHETKRKIQLERLFNRTIEQVEEEEMLVAELKKIELRKKEREKKQQDLQKLISAAEQNAESRKTQKKSNPKKVKSSSGSTSTPKLPSEAAVVFKTYDKSSGASLRSSKCKFPLTLGQKKTKTIEQVLDELSVEIRPMPTEQICVHFNELRNDILLLLELKSASDVCDFELQSLKHRDEALAPDKQMKDPSLIDTSFGSHKKSSLQFMEVVSQAAQGRKRRTTVLESALKKKKI